MNNEQELAEAVAKILKQQLPAIVRQVTKLQQPQPQPQQSFTTPTLQLQKKDNQQLQRSFSSVSTGSSVSSYGDDDVVCLGDSSENSHLAADKTVVRLPVMQHIDAAYLAPPDSALFKRFYKKKRNRDGSRSKKKHREMDVSFFNDLVRPVIRRLLGTAGINSANLSARYFFAANVLARKRRNNHMSSWRERGTCMELIYGGVLPPGCEQAYRLEQQSSTSRGRVSRKKLKMKESPVQPPKPAAVAAVQQPPKPAAAATVQPPKPVDGKHICAKCGLQFVKEADDWRTDNDLRCDKCVLQMDEELIAGLHHGDIKPPPKKKTKAKKINKGEENHPQEKTLVSLRFDGARLCEAQQVSFEQEEFS